MTLNIEVAPEVEARLAGAAGQSGLSRDELASRLLQQGLDEMAQDADDLAEVRRRRANAKANADPSQRRTLNDLRQAWKL